MKPLHESEVNFLAKVDELWKEYESLPKIDLGRMGGDEPKEMKERFDQIRYIIAIRGMLRDGVTYHEKYIEPPYPVKQIQ